MWSQVYILPGKLHCAVLHCFLRLTFLFSRPSGGGEDANCTENTHPNP